MENSARAGPKPRGGYDPTPNRLIRSVVRLVANLAVFRKGRKPYARNTVKAEQFALTDAFVKVHRKLRSNLWLNAASVAVLRPILQAQWQPEHIQDPWNFSLEYLAREVLRKCEFLVHPQDELEGYDNQQTMLEARSLAGFRAREATNAAHNKRLFQDFAEGKTPAWVWDVQREVRRIMGPLIPHDSGTWRGPLPLDRIVEACKHGPGANVGYDGVGLCISDKYDDAVTLTADLLPFARALMGQRWLGNSVPEIVDGSEVLTVPKSWNKRRVITKEPLLNMWLQLGIGRYLAMRLKVHGIDLPNQEARNRALARMSSGPCRLRCSTLDLSAASDSIVKEAVGLLVDEKWLQLLKLARCHRTTLEGEPHEFELWSSMGNGYTFPLETIIFLAIARSCVDDKDQVAVYGDDMIVPLYATERVIERLNYLGFSVNERKSFWQGDFRESCGGHYFKGVDVTPFYVRSFRGEDQEAPTAVNVANQVRLWAARLASDGVIPPGALYTVQEWWNDFVHDLCPRYVATAVPPQWGALGLIRGQAEAVALGCAKPVRSAPSWMPKSARSVDTSAWEVLRVLAFRPRGRTADKQTVGVVLSALRPGDKTAYRSPADGSADAFRHEYPTDESIGTRGVEALRGVRLRPTRQVAYAPTGAWPGVIGW